MKIIRGLRKINLATAVSVGVFDGVHTGHRKILTRLKELAARHRLVAAVVTFDPHPARIIGRPVAMLTSMRHRLSLLEALGVRLCVVVRFDKFFRRLNSGEFLKDVLVKRLNAKYLVIGGNFSFGSDNLHSVGRLKILAKKINLKICVVASKKKNKRVISSTLIRHLIEKCRLRDAKKLLARPVSILGTVVKGKQRGRIIGFKTANVDPHHEAIPPSGVYAAYAKLGKKIYKSVVNIGTRPTFEEKEPVIEAHIFGLNRDIYGADIEIRFEKRLRPERRFKNKEHLKSQILKDARAARRLL